MTAEGCRRDIVSLAAFSVFAKHTVFRTYNKLCLSQIGHERYDDNCLMADLGLLLRKLSPYK